MKKYSLISLLLCLVLLLVPMSIAANAAGEAGSSFSNPITINSIPFESGDIQLKGSEDSRYYIYTATAAATLVVTCSTEGARVSTYKNAKSESETEAIVGQGGAPIDVVADDVLIFDLWTFAEGTYCLTVTEKEA